ncbi:MAG: hypothetical protein EBU90_12265 [Proteobacteria bacterium]|nr:hypothetical protein [Pseudomonadota bacterium]
MNRIIEFAKANCKSVFNDPAHTRLKYNCLIQGYMQALADNNIPLPKDGWEDDYDPASDIVYNGTIEYKEGKGYYAEIWTNKCIEYPLCKRDLDWLEKNDIKNTIISSFDYNVFIKIINGEAVMQEPENDREPELYYE